MPMKKALVIVGVVLVPLFAAVIWLDGEQTANDPRSDNKHSRAPSPLADKSISGDHASSIAQEEVNGDAASAISIGQEFETMILGHEAIDEFVLRHLALAEAGNADSAHYVSEAMLYCAQELMSFNLSFDEYRMRADGIVVSADEISALIMDGLTGKPEFYRVEARRHLDRAIACQRLGWDSEYLYEQAVDWGETATKLGQVIAVARSASLDPENFPVEAEQIEESKTVMREVLRESRELHVFLYASSVVSASTGSDYPFERLAWALAACEYSKCDSLNYLYRGACEVMTLQGSHICTEDMTDLDYLFRKYPSQFDAALARAAEIEQALSNEDWQSIGLE